MLMRQAAISIYCNNVITKRFISRRNLEFYPRTC